MFLHNCGVGVVSGSFYFYGLDENEGGRFSEGGSIIKNHNSSLYQTSSKNAIKVDVINFSEYLEKKSENFDKIIVKMDIEGAEVDLLEHLILRGSMKNIDILYVEFHSQYQQTQQSKATKDRELRILKSLSKISTIKVRIWH